MPRQIVRDLLGMRIDATAPQHLVACENDVVDAFRDWLERVA
ncbi:hypothetical protein [Rhodobacter sp. Har01]|nr:hypothetical protein [Rhodobacter sp. Har01]